VFGKLDTIAESSRKLANNFTFQSLASTASDGTAYSAYYDCAATFEIVGSSTSKTVYFEMAGPYGVFIPVNAQNVATLDMADRTTMGTNTTPESWKVEIPAGYKFRARVEVANGNVSVAGRVVAR
jgi:hypothetical protein